MQAIKPLSGITNLTINTTNFPGLVFALRPESVLSATQCRDIIGGVVLNKASGIVNNGNGTFNFGSGILNSVTGTLPSPLATGKNPIFIVIGTMTDSNATGPGAGAAGYQVATNGFMTASRDTGQLNFHTTPNLTMSGITSGGLMLSLDCPNNAGALLAYSGSTFETAATAIAAGTLAGTWDVLGQTFDISTGPWYGMYIFHITTPLSSTEAKSALAWMVANPTLGPYPGLLYKN